MSEEETIHVAEVSEGIGGDADAEPGTPVELPIVDVLTGRGFATGKSGSGKSNTVSVIIENLLDKSYPCLIVDTDGEYYGLKEEYEILHAGADEECDIVVSPEHAEKIASLALEQNVPIILDVSGYLEEDVASELILEVTKHLFAKEKKLKKPFLLVLEECHEYIPEGGGMDETGKMLIKVGKRGRKHGLGIVGISQRPADVKKDFITQCDWLCWHRLTWDNDTTVVSRILGSEYADAIEDMDDGEAFLMTDWNESIRRIQFHRKKTFDAGATPGLDDFERPELKSVSGDLVDELQTISDEQARHESEMADLRQELDKKRQRITELERELEEARDLSNMADQFAQALLSKAEAPYRGGSGRNRNRPAEAQAGLDAYDGSSPAGTDDGSDADSSGSSSSADSSASSASSGSSASSASSAGPDVSAGGTPDDPAEDVDPVSRDEVAEGALRFDEAVELGTREAVIDELRGRVVDLPELSVAMLRHYRREGTSEPLAAHIDAGGDGDAGHAYSRHRPIRKTGLIRHAGRGQYRYAVPELVREAYANRLSEAEIAEMVAEIETAFVPEGELAGSQPGIQVSTDEPAVEDAGGSTLADESDDADGSNVTDRADDAAGSKDGDTEVDASVDDVLDAVLERTDGTAGSEGPGLSADAAAFAERGVTGTRPDAVTNGETEASTDGADTDGEPNEAGSGDDARSNETRSDETGSDDSPGSADDEDAEIL